jgi:hypothetical protein
MTWRAPHWYTMWWMMWRALVTRPCHVDDIVRPELLVAQAAVARDKHHRTRVEQALAPVLPVKGERESLRYKMMKR